MPRVETNVTDFTKELWDALAGVINIPRSSLINIAMAQYVKNNRTLLKLAMEHMKANSKIKNLNAKLKEWENELDRIKNGKTKIPKEKIDRLKALKANEKGEKVYSSV